jgi:hypothetical protein
MLGSVQQTTMHRHLFDCLAGKGGKREPGPAYLQEAKEGDIYSWFVFCSGIVQDRRETKRSLPIDYGTKGGVGVAEVQP